MYKTVLLFRVVLIRIDNKLCTASEKNAHLGYFQMTPRNLAQLTIFGTIRVMVMVMVRVSEYYCLIVVLTFLFVLTIFFCVRAHVSGCF